MLSVRKFAINPMPFLRGYIIADLMQMLPTGVSEVVYTRPSVFLQLYELTRFNPVIKQMFESWQYIVTDLRTADEFMGDVYLELHRIHLTTTATVNKQQEEIQNLQRQVQQFMGCSESK